MKKSIALVAVLILFILCLGFSALAAKATDVFPDSLPEKNDPDLNPVAAEDVYETAGAAPAPAENAEQAQENAEQAQPFSYQHDPRLNPHAMADIVEDEKAIYGFRPSETGNLKQFCEFDWHDPEMVAANRAKRLAYHDNFSELYDLLGKMYAQDAGIEEIARAISERRNQLRIKSYDGNPEGLAKMKARNLEKYGREEGPLPDQLFQEKGSWEAVLIGSLSVNSGMDACLGLYDDYYDLYVLMGQVKDDGIDPLF